jgi:hypothetical protein
VRLPRRVPQKIKDGIGGRAFFAYLSLIVFVFATPIGVFMINPSYGFISLGGASLVSAWILGAE